MKETDTPRTNENYTQIIHHDCPEEICKEVDRFIEKINAKDSLR